MTPVAGLPASNVRYQVAAFTYLLAMIVYLDRVRLATLAPAIMADFSLTKIQKITIGPIVTLVNYVA